VKASAPFSWAVGVYVRFEPLTPAVPLVPWATMLYVRVSPSTSVHEAAVEPATSSFVVRVTSEHTGAWLTALTLMLNVWGALVSAPPLRTPPLSCRTSVMFATPLAPSAGV
jgi:hypothetical protein